MTRKSTTTVYVARNAESWATKKGELIVTGTITRNGESRTPRLVIPKSWQDREGFAVTVNGRTLTISVPNTAKRGRPKHENTDLNAVFARFVNNSDNS